MAAEIRCPICGKSNPADAEVCRYCQAQLTPEVPGGGASGGASSGDEEPDWLRSLRAEDPKSEDSASTPGGETAADVPDWLSRIRKKAIEPDKSSSLFADDDSEDEAEPEWMKGLGEDENSPASFGNADDWLARLGGESPETSKPSTPAGQPGGPTGDVQPPEEADLSSWLAGLDAQEPAADKLFAPDAAPGGETVFEDWSSSALFADEESSSLLPADVVQPGAEDEDDWLSKLDFAREDAEASRSEEAAPPAASQPEPAAQPSADQAPDWDASIWSDMESGGGPAAGEPATASQPDVPAEDNLDWLSSFKVDAVDETHTQLPEAEPGDAASSWGLPGWLSQSSEPSSIEPSSNRNENLSEAGLPDWLGGTPDEPKPPAGSLDSTDSEPYVPVEQPAAQASDSEFPSWLMAEPPGPVEQLPPEAVESGVPSWLSSLEPPAAPQPPADDQPSQAPDSSVPAWMSAVNEPPALAQPTEAQPPAEEPESVVPSWLSAFEDSSDSSQHAEIQPLPEDESPDVEDLPAWLRDGFGEPQNEPAAAGQPQAGESSGWFSAIEDAPDQSPPEAQPEQEQPDFAFSPFSMLDEPTQPEPTQPSEALTSAESQPDWLTSLQSAGEEQPANAEPRPLPAAGTSPLPFIEEGLPDWMSEFQGQPPTDSLVPALTSEDENVSTSTNTDQPFDLDLPDWLDEEAAHLSAQQSEAAQDGQPAAGDLEQAELPSWVAAMRPVETALQGAPDSLETDQHLEKAGPLSGMRGVLPGDDSVISYRKPPVYSMKLRVSEKQRGHATLLENLVAQEIQPLVLPPVKSQAPQVVLRVLVALIFMVVLAGALLVNLQLTEVPTLLPLNMIEMYDQVESLAADQTVLLAVDFEPGLSGEMRFASSTVIDHLMARNVQMAIVSTVPTGPAMADLLLKQVQLTRPEYDLDGRVENLGYLPGGTISLVEFARNPVAAAPNTVDGRYAWEQPALAGIDEIQKFARVIVLTDQAEVGRDWVEQVQPYMGEVPLLVISSAQAAPLLEPYVETRQIQGLVSGLLGGTLYGQKSGRQDVNPAMGHYGTYQVGVLLAFLLVLVGAIFSSIVQAVTRKQKTRE
jgi:hypothetical protein